MIFSIFRQKSLKTLEQIGNRHGTDKTRRHGYHRFYPIFLEGRRQEALKVLEIGLHKGASLNMWLEYFPRAFVYGMDIGGPDQQGDRFHVLKGDQSDPASLSLFDGKNLDLIVDDGSHLPDHQLATFAHLFDKALSAGGLYIIEDIETSYWKRGALYGYEFRYGFRSPQSIVEVIKNGIDFLNDEFLSDMDKERLSRAYPIDTRVMRQISMISFAQNCLILHKKSPEHSRYDGREYKRRSFVQDEQT